METLPNIQIFLSTFALIFVAELPDKTALATLIMATGNHPYAVFLGAAGAFFIQCLIGVALGGFLVLLPAQAMKVGLGLLFLIFSVWMWIKKDEPETEVESAKRSAQSVKKGTFKKVLWTSFSVIFIAEAGDITQLAAGAMAAKYKAPVIVLAASTLALWTVTGLAAFLGHRAKRIINPKLLRRSASAIYFIIGWVILIRMSFSMN